MWRKKIAAAVIAVVALLPGPSAATPPPPPPPPPGMDIADPIWPMIEALYGVMTGTCKDVVGIC